MKSKIMLLIGLAILGLIAIGTGTWFLMNPVHGTEFAEKGQITLKLPDTPAIISEKLDFIMQGEFDDLYIYSDGSVIHIEEKGLRMPMPDHPPTRTWKLGNLNEEELVSLIAIFQSNEFKALDDYYQYPGKPMEPIQGAPSGGFTMGDGSFTFAINYSGFQRQVIANGFLTTDHGETYPDMPIPLNDIYVKLRYIVLNHTKEISTENIPLGGD